LISDNQSFSNGDWHFIQGGGGSGWTETPLQLGTWGKIWNSLDYWKNQYGNANVTFLGLALEFYGVQHSGGFDQPLYAGEITVNGVTYNIDPASNPVPITTINPIPGPVNQQITLDTRKDGKASMTNESTHTSSTSAKLVIPSNAAQGSCAMALYAYNKPLNSLPFFSVWASFTSAVPRFVIYVDNNNDGLADFILLSDYQFVSNGQWQIVTGGGRWGWTQASNQLNSYGTTWNQLDYWKNQYGNCKALYLGICLEYWGVYNRGGSDQPLYADELLINNGTALPPIILPISTPVPTASTQPSTTPDPSPNTTPQPITPTPHPTKTPEPTPRTTIAPAINAVIPQSKDGSSENWILLATIVALSLIATAAMLFIFRKKETAT
jgi:hypothetical protein